MVDMLYIQDDILPKISYLQVNKMGGYAPALAPLNMAPGQEDNADEPCNDTS